MDTLIAAALAGGMLLLVLRSVVRNRKGGGCGCKDCASRALCHPETDTAPLPGVNCG